jgi:hypothetical protein
MAGVCCNACRTCVQTNMISLALAGLNRYRRGRHAVRAASLQNRVVESS